MDLTCSCSLQQAVGFTKRVYILEAIDALMSALTSTASAQDIQQYSFSAPNQRRTESHSSQLQVCSSPGRNLTDSQRQTSQKPTSGAVAEPFGGGQILAQESHSRPPPTGVNGYFRERLPPRRDQRHPEDRKFT